jgi:hypothetical protein
MPFDSLVELIHSPRRDSWAAGNKNALGALFGARYHQSAEKLVALRASSRTPRTS